MLKQKAALRKPGKQLGLYLERCKDMYWELAKMVYFKMSMRPRENF